MDMLRWSDFVVVRFYHVEQRCASSDTCTTCTVFQRSRVTAYSRNFEHAPIQNPQTPVDGPSVDICSSRRALRNASTLEIVSLMAFIVVV